MEQETQRQIDINGVVFELTGATYAAKLCGTYTRDQVSARLLGQEFLGRNILGVEMVGIADQTGQSIRLLTDMSDMDLYVVVEQMESDRGGANVRGVYDSEEKASARIEALEAERDEKRVHYKYPTYWFVVELELNANGDQT